MDVNHWIAGGAIGGLAIGLVTACWSKIKALSWRVASHFVVQVELKDEATSIAILTHLVKNFQRSRVYDRTYGGHHEFTRDGKYGIIPFEYLGNKTLLFWRGWRPLIFGLAAAPQNNNANPWWNNAPTQAGKTTLTFLRGTYDVDELVARACAERNQMCWSNAKSSRQRRFFIKKVPDPSTGNHQSKYSVGTSVAWYYEGSYRLLTHRPNDLGRSHAGSLRALDALIFPERIKNLIREIQIWRNNRDWYAERAIPWKRGWILYGPPGTGKTALVRAFAEDEDMPLFVFSLGSLMNSELERSWQEMQAHVPCIALFEDIDNVFHGRTNVAGRNLGLGAALAAVAQPQQPQTGGNGQAQSNQAEAPKYGMLSFDCLLNCIDGVDKVDGVFTIITTNDISKIDPALGQPRRLPDGMLEFISSRPGRIDKAIELTYMEPDDKRLMARRILREYPEGLALMEEFIAAHPDVQETPAVFQERCAQLALAYFWKEKHAADDLIGRDTAEEMAVTALRVTRRSRELETVAE